MPVIRYALNVSIIRKITVSHAVYAIIACKSSAYGNFLAQRRHAQQLRLGYTRVIDVSRERNSIGLWRHTATLRAAR